MRELSTQEMVSISGGDGDPSAGCRVIEWLVRLIPGFEGGRGRADGLGQICQQGADNVNQGINRPAQEEARAGCLYPDQIYDANDARALGLAAGGSHDPNLLQNEEENNS